MSMHRVLEAAHTFGQPYQPNTWIGERITWGCIDERPMIINGLVVVHKGNYLIDRRNNADHRYRQSVAGPQGFGEGVGTAMRMARARNQGRFSEDFGASTQLAQAYNARRMEQTGNVSPQGGIAPAHVLGSIIAKAARVRGIDLLNHKGCAGEGAADAINNGIAANRGPQGEDIYEAIRDSHHDPRAFTRARFDFIREMTLEGMAEGMITELEARMATFDQGGSYVDPLTGKTRTLEPVGRAPLADMSHVSDGQIIDWRQGVAFDTHAALAASNIEEGDINTHYHASMGDMGEVYETFKGLFPVNADDFRDVMFVRNAATSLFLPRQHGDDQPVQLHRVPAIA